MCTVVTEPDFQNVRGEGFNFGELRQRSVSISGASDDAASRVGGDNEKVKEKEKEKEKEEEEDEESGVEVSSAVKQRAEPNGSVGSKKLETERSLDWKRLMADDPNCEPILILFLIASLLYECVNLSLFSCVYCTQVNHHVDFIIVYVLLWFYVLVSVSFTVDKSPLKYFMEEMYNGNALRNTTTIGNEVERERVYDTIFRLPWRCELVIFFLSLKTTLSHAMLIKGS